MKPRLTQSRYGVDAFWKMADSLSMITTIRWDLRLFYSNSKTMLYIWENIKSLDYHKNEKNWDRKSYNNNRINNLE